MGKFIPHLCSIVYPLTNLLSEKRRWYWNENCMKAFELAKSELLSAKVLTHYDPQLPISLAADASAYRIGAVICHTFPDGTENPVAFASSKLSTTEHNYAQMECEALSIIYGIISIFIYMTGAVHSVLEVHFLRILLQMLQAWVTLILI